MITRKIVSVLMAGLLVCSFSTNVFAELFSVSAGIPVSHTFSDSDIESDGVAGAMIHVKFPIMVGIGAESYVTKLKDVSTFDNMALSTTMIDVFYLFPIPIINFTVGLGGGTVKLECDISGSTLVSGCSDYWESGTAYQWYAQLGFPIFPFLDIHASYHNVSGTLKGKEISGQKVDDVDVGGNVIGLGVAFIF